MDLPHLVEEAQLKQVFDGMTFQTASGRQAIDSFFKVLPKSKKQVLRRTALIKEQKVVASSLWKDAKHAEEALIPYINTSTELVKQTEAEIFFTGEHTKILNTVPYLITILLALKIYITPIMGLMLPIIFFFAPYIILTVFMNTPIPWDIYITMMKEFVLGIKSDQPFSLKNLSQIIYLLTSFGQGMVQPILTAKQTYTTDSKIQEVGSSVKKYMEATQTIYDIIYKDQVLKKQTIKFDFSLDTRASYWWFRENQAYFNAWRHEVGCMDVFYTLANDSRFRTVYWSEQAIFRFVGLSDLSIKKPVKSDIAFDQHNLLTGPNRGGKSSFLRAVLQQVLFARCFGLTSCDEAEVPWVHWIHSRIRSLDKPGEFSLFEEDVRSCASILKQIEYNTHGLVLIDELFHSTNPPDALFCAKVFLGDFWRYQTVTSLISTHSFELLDTLPSSVETLCCPAEEGEDGKIKYTYKVEKGICKLSSVREVLEEAGLRIF